MPITESNICTLLDEARGKREKDMNNIFSDGGIPLLQNFAKFCLWLNWYTSIPRNKTADAAKHFDNILDKCFLGLTHQGSLKLQILPNASSMIEKARIRS